MHLNKSLTCSWGMWWTGRVTEGILLREPVVLLGDLSFTGRHEQLVCGIYNETLKEHSSAKINLILIMNQIKTPDNSQLKSPVDELRCDTDQGSGMLIPPEKALHCKAMFFKPLVMVWAALIALNQKSKKEKEQLLTPVTLPLNQSQPPGGSAAVLGCQHPWKSVRNQEPLVWDCCDHLEFLINRWISSLGVCHLPDLGINRMNLGNPLPLGTSNSWVQKEMWMQKIWLHSAIPCQNCVYVKGHVFNDASSETKQEPLATPTIALFHKTQPMLWKFLAIKGCLLHGTALVGTWHDWTKHLTRARIMPVFLHAQFPVPGTE